MSAIIGLHVHSNCVYNFAFYKVRGCATIKSKGASFEVDDLKETSEIVHAAILELRKLYNDIKKATVTGKEIESYRRQSSRLQVLYEAAHIGSIPLACHFNEVKDAIEDCVKKLAAVKQYRSKLFVVVDYCKHISKGMLPVNVCCKMWD